MKKCNRCLEEKEIIDFPKKGSICKNCISEKCREYYLVNRDKIIERVTLHTLKNIDKRKEYINKYNSENYNPEYHKEYREKNKDRYKKIKDEWYLKNREVISDKNRKKLEENRDEINKKAKERRDKNKDYYNKLNRQYIKNRKENDPLYRLTCSIRTLITQSFKSKYTKKSKKTIEILGCTFETFKEHIESKFTDEMNWDNYADYWELDHIIPVSWALNEDEIVKLNHYTNFQPLYWRDNISKGNRREG